MNQFTSTDRRILYRVTLSPNGEVFLVEANGAINAQQKGIGLAALSGINWTGMDVDLASENDITDYYGHGEEE